MRDALEIIAALGLPKPQGVIQVGASSGQEVGYFLANGIAHAILIEPLETPFRVLSARAAGIPGYVVVNALCGSVDGQLVEFHVASNNGESSSILKPARHLTDYPHVVFPEMAHLHSFTLDRIVASVHAQRPDVAQYLDLLFMDVQGAELHVLKGASATLHGIRYIYTEVGLGGGYQGDVELTELMHFLKAWGFSLYELEIGETGWGNAMFIRTLGKAPP